MKKNIWILAIVLILFLAYEIFLWKDNNKNIIKTIGEVKYLEIPVANPSPGKIDKIYVKDGDLVKQGQLLACVNTKELESKYQELLKEGQKYTELTNDAISKLTQCQENLSIKDSLLDASEYLFENKCISQEELDDVRKRQHISLEEYSKAWKNRYDVESELSASCNEANQILQEILNSKVYSNFEGRVEKVSYDDSATLLNIVNKTNLVMITSVKDQHLKNISVGNKAKISFKDIADKEFNAEVIFISKIPDRDKNYEVKLSIEHCYEHPVRIGMKGTVVIEKNQ